MQSNDAFYLSHYSFSGYFATCYCVTLFHCIEKTTEIFSGCEVHLSVLF